MSKWEVRGSVEKPFHFHTIDSMGLIQLTFIGMLLDTDLEPLGTVTLRIPSE